MFGLEDKKKKKGPEFLFDIELAIKEPENFKKYMKLIMERIQQIKNTCRQGASQKCFDEMNLLLLGYEAIFKVITRALKKK